MLTHSYSMSPVEIVVALLMIVGVLGIVIPMLPGLLIVLGGTLLWAFDEQSTLAWVLFAVATAVYVVGLALQFLVPGKRLRRAGVSTSTLLVGLVTAIVLAFVIPFVGIFIGFPLGIFLISLLRTRDGRAAWVATKHALRAVGLNMLIELATAFAIIGAWTFTITFLDRT